ncbi:MAG TPA: TonB family protein [Candidatus Baltobacteraceae bacterium]
MSQRSSRRLVLFALAISLLLHLVLAAWLRFPLFPTAPRQAAIVNTRLLRISRVVRVRHTPPPAMAARHRQIVASKPRSAATLVKLQGPPGTRAAGAAAAASTPAPTPAASPAGSCAVANAKAALSSTPPPPDLPAALRAQATSGIATVRVTVEPDGSVGGATIVGTTGNHDLDLAAVSMAQAASYAPALQKCKPVAGQYDFAVKFVAW